jgi:hypothetical protein
MYDDVTLYMMSDGSREDAGAGCRTGKIRITLKNKIKNKINSGGSREDTGAGV